MYLFIYLFIYLLIYLFIYLLFHYLFAYLFAYYKNGRKEYVSFLDLFKQASYILKQSSITLFPCNYMYIQLLNKATDF